MSATDILEQFRRLSFDEQCEVVRRLRDEFEDELTPGQIATFEERAERLRRHPEKGIKWEKIRADLKNRPNKKHALAGK